MTAEPGDRAVAAGGGHLRASDADRERAIDALKTAFVHGALTKEELDHRTGRALSSRTYAELDAVTADLPARRLIAAVPEREPARPHPARKKVAAWAACAVITPGLGAAFLTYYGGFLVLFLLTFLGATLTAGPVHTTPNRRRW